MNVFIIGTPIDTAKVLDNRRLNKQIIECKQILKAIDGDTKAWVNHPATLQYKNHRRWLFSYMMCLIYYKDNQMWGAEQWSKEAEEYKPYWHTENYFTQMKRRLFTKNNEHYSQWSHLGESEINMYYVNNKWKYYKNGKVIEL